MSVKQRFYRDGAAINPPLNWKEISIELNFDKDKESVQPQLALTNLEWVRENNNFVEQFITDGTTTGPGIFEGVPLRFEIDDGNGTIENIFDGYIDFTEGVFSSIQSTLPIKEKEGIDWLNDVADSFTFEYLHEVTGEISDSDFVAVPYVINSIPNYREAGIALVTAFMVTNELTQSISILTQLGIEMANAFEVSALVRAILEVLRLIALIIALVKLIKDLILLLIQPVKYHMGMSVKTLLEKGAEHLNCEFKCESLETTPFSKLYVIPEKLAMPTNPDDDRILNFTTPDNTQQVGYFKGTFGNLLRAMKTFICGKVTLTKNSANGKTQINLLREDKTTATPQFQIPPIWDEAENITYRINADTFYANYSVEFLYDVTDKNTIQEFIGTVYQVITKPDRILNQNYILMKGLREEKIPFALGKRKTELTVPEEICKDLLTAVDLLLNGIISAVNGLTTAINAVSNVLNSVANALNVIGIDFNFTIQPIPAIPYQNLAGLITNRIGMLKIEFDHFTVPKLVIIDVANEDKNTKVNSLNDTYLSAQYLYDNFHYVRSWIPSNEFPNGAQCIIKTYEDVPFTFANYLQVKNCNKCFTAAGESAEIVSLKWNTYNQTATVTVWISKLLTNNFRVETLIPNGQ